MILGVKNKVIMIEVCNRVFLSFFLIYKVTSITSVRIIGIGSIGIFFAQAGGRKLVFKQPNNKKKY